MKAAELISLFIAYRSEHGRFPSVAYMAPRDIGDVLDDLTMDAGAAYVAAADTPDRPRNPDGREFRFRLLGVRVYDDSLVELGKPELA